MTYIEIPLRTDLYSYFQNVVIDDVVYKMEIRYNGRMERWFMSLSDASGNALLAGIPLLPGYPLTEKFRGCIENFPAGQFVIVDETEAERTPTRDNLGEDIKLIYVSE